jgi:hypothetical protein
LARSQNGNDQNISGKDGRFLERENDRLTDHVHHAIHHDFTIKIPSAAHGFSKTTVKNTSNIAFFGPRLSAIFFS